MDDFYQSFKDNLENRPEPPFEEKDWQALEKRLTAKSKKPMAGLIWWLLVPLLLLPLLFTNLYFYQELKTANAKIDRLQFQRDTIYITQTIIQRDTIYQKQHITNKNSTSPVTPIAFQLPALPNFTDNVSYVSIEKIWSAQFPPSISYASTPQQQSEITTIDLFDPIPTQHGHFLDLQMRNLPSDIELIPITSRKKRPLWNLVKPKGVQAGINGGVFLPLNSDLNPSLGLVWSIQANVKFSQRLRLRLNMAYLVAQFESKQMDERLGIPIIPSPGETYTFEKASITQPALQYSGGLQYFFFSRRKWKPYIGIGYGLNTLQSYQIKYKFEEENTETESITERKIEQGKTIKNLLLFQLGFEKTFGKRWHWYVEGNYRHQLGEKEATISNLIGIRTGLLYSF